MTFPSISDTAAVDIPTATRPPGDVHGRVLNAQHMVDGFVSPLAARFIGDWHALRRDSSNSRAVANWSLGDGGAALCLDEVLVRSGFLGQRDHRCENEVMIHVVRLAATDVLAARVVLQRLMPLMVAIAKRRGGNGWEARGRCFDELTASAWLTIRNFPIERRTINVAANLARDVEYKAFVHATRRKSATETCLGADRLPEQAVDVRGLTDERRSAMERVIEVIVDGRDAGLAEADLQLVVRMASGMPVSQMARERGISPRALLPHRQRAIENLRRLAA